MKKTAVLLTLILALYASGCAKTEPQNTKEPPSQTAVSVSESTDVTPSASEESSLEPVSVPSVNPIKEASIIVNEVDDEEGTIYIGQSSLDVNSIFYQNDIEIKSGDDDSSCTDYLEISFFKGKVDGILVMALSEIPTSLGLNFGDSLEQMTDIYGTEYKVVLEFTNGVGYEYEVGDHIFYVEFYDEKVAKWGIHK
jgi:hypothetical protein